MKNLTHSVINTDRQTGRLWLTLVLTLFVLALMTPVRNCAAITRTLHKDPAIVLVAFGTTTDAGIAYDAFEEQLHKSLPPQYAKANIEWAFTSEIVRERVNARFRKNNESKRYRSLAQVLADLEDAGYRKIVIQSLHIFPGQEYEDMVKVIDAFRSLGLHIEYGGTLLNTWERAHEAVSALESDFLPPSQGCNILAAHGTPETFPGSNSTYLGLDRYLDSRYANVFLGCVSGVITKEDAFAKALACNPKKVRIIPFMYVAGDHVMNDIMGKVANKKGEISWAMELEQKGLEVETVHEKLRGKNYYKGLGLHPEINAMLIKELLASLQRMENF